MKRAWGLLGIGVLAMAGDLLGIQELYGLGMATHVSPAPKVFTTRDGLEGFSAVYTLRWEGPDGPGEVVLTPEVYAQLEGPYNRRNVFGAALAGGPFLTDHEVMGELHAQVSRWAFCEADVLQELGVGRSPERVELVVTPREGTVTELPLVLEVAC